MITSFNSFMEFKDLNPNYTKAYMVRIPIIDDTFSKDDYNYSDINIFETDLFNVDISYVTDDVGVALRFEFNLNEIVKMLNEDKNIHYIISSVKEFLPEIVNIINSKLHSKIKYDIVYPIFNTNIKKWLEEIFTTRIKQV